MSAKAKRGALQNAPLLVVEAEKLAGAPASRFSSYKKKGAFCNAPFAVRQIQRATVGTSVWSASSKWAR